MCEVSLTDMYRLCLSKDKLYWVFDRRYENEDNMKYMILITTGVDIKTTDVVSQNICDKCCRAIVNMFKFRKTSLETDRRLKEELKKLDQIAEEIPDDHLQSEKESVKPSLAIHASMMQLFQCYPNIKLPNMCLTTPIKPVVVMPMNAVENYFKTRKLSFREHCRLALKIKNAPRKKTFKPSITKRVNAENVSFQIKAQIIPRPVEDAVNVLRPITIKISKVQNMALKTYQQREEFSSPCNKKRKLLVQNSVTKENDEHKEINHSTQFSKVPKSLSYMHLHMCSICESVHSTSKGLRKHQYKHIRCQFCTTSFRPFKSKTEHLEGNCLVKNAITNIPCIELPRIENNKDVVRKFPEVFTNFPSLIDIQHLSSETITLNSRPEEECSKDIIEIIEIVSGDDDVLPKCDTSESAPATTTALKTTSAIKPDVRIINSPFSGIVNTESGGPFILRNLLSSYKLSADKDTQTDLHDQLDDVEVDENKLTAVFPNFRRHMEVFRVLVKINHGPFNASYRHSANVPHQPTRLENLRLWNDLTPIDVKKNNTKDASINETNTTGSSTSSSGAEQNIYTNMEESAVPQFNVTVTSHPKLNKPNNSVVSNTYVVDSPAISSFTKPSTTPSTSQEPRSLFTPTSISTTTTKDVSTNCTVANVVQSSSYSIATPIPSKTTSAKPVQFKVPILRKLIPLSKFSKVFSDSHSDKNNSTPHKNNQLTTPAKVSESSINQSMDVSSLSKSSSNQQTIFPGSLKSSVRLSDLPKFSNVLIDDASGRPFSPSNDLNNFSLANRLLKLSTPKNTNKNDAVGLNDCLPINTVTSQGIVDPKVNVTSQHNTSRTEPYVTKSVSYISSTPRSASVPYMTNVNISFKVSCITTLRTYWPPASVVNTTMKSTSECVSSHPTSNTSAPTYPTTANNSCTYLANYPKPVVDNAGKRFVCEPHTPLRTSGI